MKRVTALLFILILAACGKAPPVTPDSFYRLPEPGTGEGSISRLSQGIVLVRPLLSDGLRSERAILFSDDPGGLTLRQHHYYFWVDTPQRLVQRQFIAYLRAWHAAPMVMGETDVLADRVISGRIIRFEYSRDGERKTVHLELELRVDRAGDEHPMLLNDYRADIPVDGRGMDAVVMAFNQGLEQVFKAFVEDLRSHRQGHGGGQ